MGKFSRTAKPDKSFRSFCAGTFCTTAGGEEKKCMYPHNTTMPADTEPHPPVHRSCVRRMYARPDAAFVEE